MDATLVTLRGTLKDDGTLELPRSLDLPPGPVEVTVRTLSDRCDTRNGDDWWAQMQQARAELEARGGPFREAEEIDADIAGLRDWD